LMFVCCECCVLSGSGFCDGLITRREESYRPWRVVVCDHETSKNEEAKARYRAVENTTTMGCNARKTDKGVCNLRVIYWTRVFNQSCRPLALKGFTGNQPSHGICQPIL
jgi:hypothetical protein